MVKSPSKSLSIEFLKGLQANNYLSPQGKEYCAEEVDLLLSEKLTSIESVESWAGFFDKSVAANPPAFWTVARCLDPKFISIY